MNSIIIQASHDINLKWSHLKCNLSIPENLERKAFAHPDLSSSKTQPLRLQAPQTDRDANWREKLQNQSYVELF